MTTQTRAELIFIMDPENFPNLTMEEDEVVTDTVHNATNSVEELGELNSTAGGSGERKAENVNERRCSSSTLTQHT